MTEYNNNKSDKEALLRFMQDAECFNALTKWTSDFDMFDVLKISRTEIRHSNLLGWLLNPNENHGMGDSFLYGMLAKLSHDVDSHTALRFLSSDLYFFNVYREWNHIDILLVSNQSKLAVVIENKIGSHEHNSNKSEESQLKTYKNKVESHYQDYTKLYVFLTPDGEEPSEEGWMVLDYANIVDILENSYQSKCSTMGKESALLIKNYINTIKKKVIMDQELVNLCNSIYNKHRRALDLIFENREDVVSQASNICRKILSAAPGVVIDESSKGKTYVKFRTDGLCKFFEDIDPLHYYYQFEIRKDGITIMLEYHKNSAEKLDDEVMSCMTEFKKKFPKSRNIPQENWTWFRVWTEKTDELFDEMWLKGELNKILRKDGTESIMKLSEQTI